MKTITSNTVEETMNIPLGTISAIKVGADNGITIKVSMVNRIEKEIKIYKVK